MDAFLAETIERRPALFRAVVQMNRALLPTLPAFAPLAGRLEEDAPAPADASSVSASSDSSPSESSGLPAALLRDPLIRRALRRSALAAHAPADAPAPSGWWDFSEETRRLALLPAEAVRDAALRFSAAVFADDMARLIDREQVLALRQALGADVVSYALRRGRWQVGSLRQRIAPGLAALPLPQRVLRLARAVLFAAAQEWPAPLRELWFQRLALDPAEAAALPALDREQRRALWFTLKKILLREAAPTWAPCFD